MLASIGGFFLPIPNGLPQYRRRLHGHYSGCCYWHRVLAVATIVSLGYYILGSRF